MALDRVVVKMTQCPVGQGGFFCGTLSSNDKNFRWVYDCGANNALTTQLKREIDDKIPRDCIVDALYFSHLHSDHISGVDYLLRRCKVKQIVLPYLNDSDKYFSLLHHFVLLHDGQIEDNQFNFAREFIVNPVGFCSERGVEKLVQVREATIGPDDDGRDEDRFEDLTPSESDDHVDIWYPSPELQSPIGSGAKSSARVYTAKADAFASVSIQDINFNWEFVPYVHPIPENVRKKFVEKVNHIIGNDPNHPLDASQIYSIADSRDKLRNLLAYYKGIVPTVNPLSMSLYTGPKFHVGGEKCSIFGNTILFNGCISNGDGKGLEKIFAGKEMISSKDLTQVFRNTNGLEGGWILTGDSDFKRSSRLGSGRYSFEKFKNRYRKYRSSINVVMVPHHGSKNNVTDEFFNFFENPFMTYVAAGPTKHHPSQEVVCMACAASGPFYVVGTDIESELTLRSEWQFH